MISKFKKINFIKFQITNQLPPFAVSDEVDLYEIKHGDEVLAGKSYDAMSDVRGPIASNQLILVGVGLLLGVILLVVVVCVVLLAWKQRRSSKQNGQFVIVSRFWLFKFIYIFSFFIFNNFFKYILFLIEFSWF